MYKILPYLTAVVYIAGIVALVGFSDAGVGMSIFTILAGGFITVLAFGASIKMDENKTKDTVTSLIAHPSNGHAPDVNQYKMYNN